MAFFPTIMSAGAVSGFFRRPVPGKARQEAVGVGPSGGQSPVEPWPDAVGSGLFRRPVPGGAAARRSEQWFIPSPFLVQVRSALESRMAVLLIMAAGVGSGFFRRPVPGEPRQEAVGVGSSGGQFPVEPWPDAVGSGFFRRHFWTYGWLAVVASDSKMWLCGTSSSAVARASSFGGLQPPLAVKII